MSPSPESAPPSDRGARSSTVEGAVPPRPPMTPAEMLEEIDRAAGPFRRLRELRALLPTAHNRRPGGYRPSPADDDAPIGAAPRPPGPAAGAVAGAGPAVPAGQELTIAQRQTVIDQALLMLEALVRPPAAEARAARHRPASSASGCCVCAIEALDERELPVRDDRDLRRAARPPHQLHPAETYTRQVRLPAVPDRGVLRRRRAQVPDLVRCRRATRTPRWSSAVK